MKIHNTKPTSKSFTTKSVLVLSAVLIAVAVPFSIFSNTVYACSDSASCQAEINRLQSQINSYNAVSSELIAQSITLQSTLSQMANQAAVLQAQIDISQAKYDSLMYQIEDTENKIQNNKDALGSVIADMYVDDSITPIEMLASSKNIGDYLDKQEYRSSISSEISATISQIKELKDQLEVQKTEVQQVLDQQKTEMESLQANKNRQQELLDATKGQEAAYQSLISSSYSQIEQARAIQIALTKRGNQTGGQKLLYGGLLPEYGSDVILGGWNDSNCSMGGYVNGIWYDFASNDGSNGSGGDGHGYGCRQCASYVAWKVYRVTGRYPPSFDAQDFSYGSQIDSPVAGSVGVLDAGSFGHVAWVESAPYINNEGRLVIKISQYNYDYGAGYGMYSITEVSPSFFDRYYKI